MNYNQISSLLPCSSVLGFGCSGIAGRISKKESITIIQKAIDLGITHFDVAPSYGYGEAEACLGEALGTKRKNVVVATKVGILPGKTSGLIRKLKPIAQQAIRIFPQMRKITAKSARFAAGSVINKQFSIEKIKTSVENSLIQLKTDYLDILFLHDCTQADLSPELFEFLESLKLAGKIRIYGLATTIETINSAYNMGYHDFVAQFSNNTLQKNHCKLQNKNNMHINHSAFSCYQKIIEILKNNRTKLINPELWPLQKKDVRELLLGYVLLKNKNGVVICSMLSDSHLRDNIDFIENPRFSEKQIMHFISVIDKPLN